MRRALLATLFFGGCGSGGSSGGISPAAPNVELESVSADLVAAEGGRVAFADGTTLEIPPGALPADTTVTLRRPASFEAFPGRSTAGAVELLPDGLELAAPASLTLRYDASKVTDEGDLLVVVVSQHNELPRHSGEINPFDEVAGALIDAAGDRAVIPIDHFSWYSVFSLPKLNIGLEIPERYLLPGDILYALTNGINFNDATALPIHVGMFVGNGKVIESTLPSSDCTPEYIEGVETHDYEGSKGFKELCGAHVFLGARRPRVGTTAEVREAAVAAARSRLGKPYGIAGLNDAEKVGIIVGGISCVELTEDSWEEAGINISLTPDVFLWPHDQFASTLPVDRIPSVPGDRIVIPIVGAYRYEKSRYKTGGTPNGIPMELEVTADPDVFAAGRASLQPSASPQALKNLVFTPSRDDETKQIVFTITLRAMGVSETLRFQVEVDEGQPCDEEDLFDLASPGAEGTFAGTANDMPFSSGNASLALPALVDDFGDVVFDSSLTEDPDAFADLLLIGVKVYPANQIGPGRSFTVTLPFQLLDPAGSSLHSLRCGDILAFAPPMSGSMHVTLDADCRGLEAAIIASATATAGAGRGQVCTINGTFRGRIPDP